MLVGNGEGEGKRMILKRESEATGGRFFQCGLIPVLSTPFSLSIKRFHGCPGVHIFVTLCDVAFRFNEEEWREREREGEREQRVKKRGRSGRAQENEAVVCFE